MEDAHLLDTLRQIREDIKDGFQQVHVRLDALNGRLRETEANVAVLEDRATRDMTARVGGGLSLMVATIGALYQYLKGH